CPEGENWQTRMIVVNGRPGVGGTSEAASILGPLQAQDSAGGRRLHEARQLGALLRREGLYTSHLSAWRKQRDAGAPQALGKSRGRPRPNPLEAENAVLRRRAERAEAELARARKVIEVQGKVSALLDELLTPRGATPDERS